MDAIKTEHLCKRYRSVEAVHDLDLTVHEGEIFTLLGVNGAGKTTAIKLLTGLTEPTAGDAFIFGTSVVRDPYGVKEMIDVSMQETAVARNLTVRENLNFYAGIAGLSKEEACRRIDEMIDRFLFESVLKRRAKNLSGGWQRKLSIALALLSRPRLLFLDEPTLGLDVLARRELWNVIRDCRTTVFLTTHYLEEAEHLSDRIGVMKRGRLLCAGTVSELLAQTGASSLEDAFVALSEGEV